MNPVVLAHQMSVRGFGSHELARMQRSGELVKVRRGAYVQPGLGRVDEEAFAPAPSEVLAAKHRLLIEGTLPQLHPRAVISHGSAAVLHGLPVFPHAVRRVHLTRDRRGGGVIRSVVHVHGSPLSLEDVAVVDGIPVTSLARTVADLARTLRYAEAVAVGDHALGIGLDPVALAVALDLGSRRSGAGQGRRVATFIDGRSESVGESFSRVTFAEDDLPPPELQFTVYDDLGRLVGRSDFGWPAHRTLGEFDGREKYLRFRRPGESLEEYLLREKQREDALRGLGWEVVRWGWGDLSHSRVVADRLRRAFARARQRPARDPLIGSMPA